MPASPHRRNFLKTSTASLAGTTLLAAAPPVHAGGSDELKVGLIGCGGRGTGAAEQACNAGPGIKLWAMGDMFKDRLDGSRRTLQRSLGDRMQVAEDRCFTGFDAFQGVLSSGVDVVCLAAPPHFRPQHLEAAVAAGKHVFCEKPMAVDAPGVRRVMKAAAEAKARNLAIVAGFCWRYHDGMREIFKRVHDGAIGEVIAIQSTYNADLLWKRDRQPDWSDMEWQLRNWLYFTWLSGDHIVEQAVHSIDKIAWTMKDVPPVKAYGSGGRQTRTAPEWGHIFDHHAVVFEFANGTRAYHYCRQQSGVHREVADTLLGTKGVAEAMQWKITGPNAWQYPSRELRKLDMYQAEHNELFASIRAGKPINDGEWMCQSTLMAIMGRMATYTGQVITWDMAMNSKEDLTPPKYVLGPLPTPPVAMPGITKFV
jgi:predicted dehydrogenase